MQSKKRKQPDELKPPALIKSIIENRQKMMADRLAILLTICNARDEDEWNPWALERTYDGEDCMGEHIRKMKDYKTAMAIVRMWTQKSDKAAAEEYWK